MEDRRTKQRREVKYVRGKKREITNTQKPAVEYDIVKEVWIVTGEGRDRKQHLKQSFTVAYEIIF